MGNGLFAYIQQLEMLAFFPGYPLVFFLVRIIFHKSSYNNGWRAVIISILPYAYALIGSLFLVLLLKNIYPDYSSENIKLRVQQPYLVIWGLLSILFWIPALARKQMLSLLHSLVFFFLIIKDLFFYFTGQIRDRDIIRNDMHVYTVSIFMNLAAFTLLILFFFLLRIRKKYPGS